MKAKTTATSNEQPILAQVEDVPQETASVTKKQTSKQQQTSVASPHTVVNTRCERSYRIVRKIGSGAYGKVYAAWSTSTTTSVDSSLPANEMVPCAIKMPIRIGGSVVTGISSLKEIDMLTRCNHPYIMKLRGVERDLYSAIAHAKSHGSSADSSAAAAGESTAVEKAVDLYQSVKTAKYDRVSLMMELAIGNTEDVHVHSFSDEKLRLCITELLLALEYMSEKRIVHRDLKPGNILLFAKSSSPEILRTYMQNLQPLGVTGPKQHAANKQVISRFLADASSTSLKICDFGMSKICNNYLHSRGVVTLWYRAPEIAEARQPGEQNTKYTCASDWWSFGCILYEWITGSPFAASSTTGDDETQDRNLLDLIRTNLDRLEQNNWDVVHNALKNRSGFSRAEKNCLVNMLKFFLRVNPSERISPRNALNQSFFQPLREKITQDRLCLPQTEFCASSYAVASTPAPSTGQEDIATNTATVTITPISTEPITRTSVLDGLPSSVPREMSQLLLSKILQYRENVYLFAVELFRTRFRREYHTNRRLFLALELFDRLCLWLWVHRQSNPLLALLDFTADVGDGSSSSSSSTLSSAEKTGVLFVVLYYISVKYLSSFDACTPLRFLLTRKVVQDGLFSGTFFEELELFLVKEVFHYQVGPNRVIKTFDRPQGSVFSSLGRTASKSRKKRTELIYLNAYEALCHLEAAGGPATDEAAVLPLYLLHWKQKSSFYEFVKLFTPC